jgi:uncharacterized protein
MIVDNNPFFQGGSQSFRTRAICDINVAGVPVTDNLDPFLLSVRVFDGYPSTAEVELDDRDARLPIPPRGADLVISLGWSSESMQIVFRGVVSDVEHGFDRKRGGRRMWVHGLGMQAESAIKSPFTDHIGDGAEPGQQQGKPIPFLTAAQQFAANGGAIAAVGPSLLGVTQDYWSQNGESPLEWFTRHAEQFGAMFRVESGNVMVIGRPEDFQKGHILARWGDNLISWKIHPLVARPVWNGALQQFFDTQQALWKDVQRSGFSGGGNATYRLPMPAPNQQAAQQQVDGAQATAENTKGHGTIVINGEPNARYQSTVTLMGAKPGVDGTYLITSAEHLYSRQGYTTTLEVWPEFASDSTFASFPVKAKPQPTFAQQPLPQPQQPQPQPPQPALPFNPFT